jgi:hypothetical protein
VCFTRQSGPSLHLVLACSSVGACTTGLFLNSCQVFRQGGPKFVAKLLITPPTFFSCLEEAGSAVSSAILPTIFGSIQPTMSRQNGIFPRLPKVGFAVSKVVKVKLDHKHFLIHLDALRLMDILLRISLSFFPSSVNSCPRYTKLFTCSLIFPFIIKLHCISVFEILSWIWSS